MSRDTVIFRNFPAPFLVVTSVELITGRNPS